MSSMPPCSRPSRRARSAPPLEKTRSGLAKSSSRHMSSNAPPATTYSSRCHSGAGPAAEPTGFQARTRNAGGSAAKRATEAHTRHRPTARSSEPGSTCPTNVPIGGDDDEEALELVARSVCWVPFLCSSCNDEPEVRTCSLRLYGSSAL
uniref:Uncharacterized protein n=1 Tax=Arundo donax TaxID=35708 RepID=A0A0A9DAC0_ARUDO